MASVTLENLAKTYSAAAGSGINAVRGASLEIADGEFMVLVGPSGCGKSTTLRMIAGLEEPSSGTVSIAGRPVNGVPPKDRDIAMVFQNYALYPHMTVYENMAFGLKLRKVPKDEIERRVGEAAQMLGLSGELRRRPAELSGGQRQRVALGRAIVRKPSVFLFDEPLSNLDAKMRATTRTEISRLHAALGATMIYVTHDQTEAMTMGDRICVMNEGRIMQVARPLDLYDTPANLFVAQFIGSPPMNLFAGTVRVSGSRVTLEGGPDGPSIELGEAASLGFSGLAGRKVVLGIRPEAVREAGAGEPGLEATLDVAEALGSETLLYLKAANTALTARVPPTDRYHPGQRLVLALDTRRARFFDRESGQAIERADAADKLADEATGP